MAKSSILSLTAFVLLVPGHAATISASAGPITIAQPGTISFDDGIGGRSQASVDFGFAFASADSNCLPGVQTRCSADAFAQFSDVITIFGTNGILQDTISRSGIPIDGSADNHFEFGSLSGSFLGFQFFGSACAINPPGCQQNFTAGVGISFLGTASGDASDEAPQDPNSGSEAGTSSLSFSFSVLDSNGLPISGFQYTSQSGHDYGISGGTFVAPAPEPAAISLAPIGFLILVLLGRLSLRDSPV